MLTSNSTDFLFVYGTLMKSYGRNPFISEMEQFASFQSPAFTTGELYLIDYYPGFIKTENFEFVYGELFEIHNPENLFAVLDPYEGFNPEDSVNSLYVREEIEVFLDINKNSIKAWAYVFNKPAHLYRRIESGNFMDFAEAGE